MQGSQTIGKAPVSAPAEPERASLLYDPKIRGIVYQLALILVVGFLIYEATTNAIENLRAQKIASGFGFLGVTSGFDINQTLIPYSATSTYGRAFWVGLLNTLLVAAIGIVFATILGFIVGVARLSKNWLVATVATVYVEVIRNLPLLLQLYFWYNAVLKAMPGPRDSWAFPMLAFGPDNWLPAALMVFAILAGYAIAVLGARVFPDDLGRTLSGLAGVLSGLFLLVVVARLFGWPFTVQAQGLVFLNNRGLILPDPQFRDGAGWIGLAFLVAMVLAFVFRGWARRQQDATGVQYPVGLIMLALIAGLPFLAYWLAGKPVDFTYPALRGFNFQGECRSIPNSWRCCSACQPTRPASSPRSCAPASSPSLGDRRKRRTRSACATGRRSSSSSSRRRCASSSRRSRANIST